MIWDRENRVKSLMAEGKPVLGFFVCTPESALVEIMGLCGFDFAAFDMEHGRFGMRDIESLIRTCDSVGLTPMVRIPFGDYNVALRCLEAGARGVVMSHTKTAKDARDLVNCCRFAPQGRRGFAVNTRSSAYGINSPKAYIETVNKNMIVAAMIEDVEGVENLDEILKVDGLDLMFVGPGDLSNDMGHVCEFSHPEVLKTIDRIAEKTLAAGREMAMFASDFEVAKTYLRRGVRMIAYKSEVDLFAEACRRTVDAFKKIGGKSE